MSLADRMQHLRRPDRGRENECDEIPHCMGWRTRRVGGRSPQVGRRCPLSAGVPVQWGAALRVASAAAMAPDRPCRRGNSQSLGDRGVPARDRRTSFGSARIRVLSRHARPRCAQLYGLARANLDGRSAVVRACVGSYATVIGSLVSLSANVDTKDADKERSSTQCRHVLRCPGWRRVAASMLPEACTSTHFLECLSGSCP